MRAATPPTILAEIHVTGPIEREPRQTRRGTLVTVAVQRCLRCDALLTEAAPLFPVGARIALAPSGGRMKRYVLGGRELRDGEAACAPVPFAAL